MTDVVLKRIALLSLPLALIGIVFAADVSDYEVNRLTDQEAAAGWRLLFDGSTVRGWTGLKGTPFPSGSWKVERGALRTLDTPHGRDIVSEEKFDNFELAFDYKISPGGNSGVKYLVQQEWLSPHWTPDQTAAYKADQAVAAVGYEFQIHDDAALKRQPGWEAESTGALYLLVPPGEKRMNPPGEWNSARVVVDGMHVEHWLNGKKLLEYELGSKELLDKVEKTKFRKVPGYGQKGPGNIVLQHHGSPVWFRNVRVKEL